VSGIYLARTPLFPRSSITLSPFLPVLLLGSANSTFLKYALPKPETARGERQGLSAAGDYDNR